jgi:hypothetical protein
MVMLVVLVVAVAVKHQQQLAVLLLHRDKEMLVEVMEDSLLSLFLAVVVEVLAQQEETLQASRKAALVAMEVHLR